MSTNAELLEAFNYGTRTERSGSETGLDRISRRYSGDLYAAACDGYSLSAQLIDPKPYRDAIRAGEWSLDLYETVGGN